MRYIVAMDSYKGSLSSSAAADAVSCGILAADSDAVIRRIPIADGGEGTVEAYLAACGGIRRPVTVCGPLGKPLEAFYGILPDRKTVVIEMAAASGLPMVPENLRDPKITTTRGTGDLLRTAINAGSEDIILGIGGSSTNDGGTGLLRALGIRFLDADGHDLPEGGAALANLASIDLSGFSKPLSRIRVACDVDNPLCGERGASTVFGPQKGASPEDVALLDAALAHYADIAAETLGFDLRNDPGAGAAGGVGFALKAFLGAELIPGVELLLDTVDLDSVLADSDIVITGEGGTDFQTAFGKAPCGVARRASKYGLPVFIISGGLGRGYRDVYAQGVTAAFSIADRPMTLEASIADGARLLSDAAERLTRTILAVRK